MLESTFSFYLSRFFYMTKKSRQKFKYLDNEKLSHTYECAFKQLSLNFIRNIGLSQSSSLELMLLSGVVRSLILLIDKPLYFHSLTI